MTSTSIEKVRLTISVSPEVHATFSRMAVASNTSLSRAMGDWLGETQEAAAFLTTKMEEARQAPRRVIREMHAYALGLADETGQLMEQLQKKGRAPVDGKRSAAAGARPSPPSGNTGGKGPNGPPRKTPIQAAARARK